MPSLNPLAYGAGAVPQRAVEAVQTQSQRVAEQGQKPDAVNGARLSQVQRPQSVQSLQAAQPVDPASLNELNQSDDEENRASPVAFKRAVEAFNLIGEFTGGSPNAAAIPVDSGLNLTV